MPAMNEGFQPQPPMFEEGPTAPQPRQKRNRRKSRGRPVKTQQPEPTEPRGPKKPKEKPRRKYTRKIAAEVVKVAAHVPRASLDKSMFNLVGTLVAMSARERETVFRLVKAILK